MRLDTRSEMTQDAIQRSNRPKRVDEALKAYDAARNPGTEAKIKNKQQDDHVEENVNNRNSNENGDGNPNVNNKGVVPVARECTYQDFVNCQPLNFKGTKGVYATCTFLDGALTWWNSHKRTIRVDDAYAMTWKVLIKLMTKVYYPRNEIQKTETKLWNLRVKSNDLTAYNQRFQELTLLRTKMVPEEKDKNFRYRDLCCKNPMDLANNPMDQKLKGYAIKNAENKRRFKSSSRDNRQQQPFKRQNVSGQNVARAYTIRNNVVKKGYARVLPYCNKCIMHHEGPCIARCGNCKKVGHMTRDYRTAVAATP
ncbi:putative reverse transcriptase domain-containing protein [Tanacetum coccineum]